MKTNFKYSGFVTDNITITLGERQFMIQALDNNMFEVYTEGGSHGIFKTLGKAMNHAETFLIKYVKQDSL